MSRRKIERPRPAFEPPRGPCRFVVLKHTVGDAEHYDLMLQWSPGADAEEHTLKTWSTESNCCPSDGCVLTRKPDHRQAYLDYEGPVRADQGEVSRADAGIFRVLDDPIGGHIAVSFLGRRLRGSFLFEPYSWSDGVEQVRLRGCG